MGYGIADPLPEVTGSSASMTNMRPARSCSSARDTQGTGSSEPAAGFAWTAWGWPAAELSEAPVATEPSVAASAGWARPSCPREDSWLDVLSEEVRPSGNWIVLLAGSACRWTCAGADCAPKPEGLISHLCDEIDPITGRQTPHVDLADFIKKKSDTGIVAFPENVGSVPAVDHRSWRPRSICEAGVAKFRGS